MSEIPVVFLNASVILAGLYSPNGGSAKVLHWGKQKKIYCLISEIVYEEVLRHADKIQIPHSLITQEINSFAKIMAPPKSLSNKYTELVKDQGDLHLFSSCEEFGVDFLVSLDRKHVLDISDKITEYKIVSPGELIELLSL